MEEYQEKMIHSSFLYLTLDLPSAPLYKDEMEHNIIPQIPLATLLAKFNGLTEKVWIKYQIYDVCFSWHVTRKFLNIVFLQFKNFS